MLIDGQVSKSKVIFLSFSTAKRPQDADVFIKAAGRDLQAVRSELVAQYPTFDPTTMKGKPTQRELMNKKFISADSDMA